MDHTNILLEIKSILEVKLNLIQILIDKKDCIRNQEYEKTADLRMQEKELYKFLNDKKIELIDGLKKMENNNSVSDDEFWFLSAINEIESFDQFAKKNEKSVGVPNPHLNDTFQNLIRLKDEIIKKYRMD
jgi:hypothetical protein